ncbi:MAG TPA: NAD(P)H-dependent oxidoreductase [Rhizomicrobium sp.]|nr:NAD(P)H-dependent oxidoreductase [Rhizomicrobium sp.]
MSLLEPLYVPRARRPVQRQSASPRKILVVNGHPDPRPERFCAALCDAYEAGAQAGAWQARRLNVGALALAEPETIAHETGDATLELMRWSNRLVIVFPLWLDKPPERLRNLFERLARANNVERPASVVVTMEMPAFAHRAACRAASSGHIELPGIKTEKPIFIGCVDMISAAQRKRWLQSIHSLGVRGT